MHAQATAATLELLAKRVDFVVKFLRREKGKVKGRKRRKRTRR
jgi:hypothetical protein